MGIQRPFAPRLASPSAERWRHPRSWSSFYRGENTRRRRPRSAGAAPRARERSVRFASERTGRTLALVGLLAGLAAGCTAPQSGVFQSHWCHPAPTEGLPTVMLDDMEDGDSVPCLGTGRWMVEGTGDFAPDPPGAAAVPPALSDDAHAVRAPRTRALPLSRTLPADGWGGL